MFIYFFFSVGKCLVTFKCVREFYQVVNLVNKRLGILYLGISWI